MKRLIFYVMILVNSVACVSWHKTHEAPVTPPPSTDKVPKAAVEPSTPPLSVAGAENTPAMEVTATPAAEPFSTSSSKIDAKAALLWLQHGNQRFVKRRLRSDGQSKKDILRVSKTQFPHAIVLACSDSQVPPEIIFDQKLGEIFVVRTAGESLDASVIASVEYAVQYLGPHLLLVLGHTSCGAIKAALQTPPGTDTGSPSMNHLFADLQPRVRSNANQPWSSDLGREALANATGIIEDLQKSSAVVREAVKNGRLTLQPALYHLNTGEVTFE